MTTHGTAMAKLMGMLDAIDDYKGDLKVVNANPSACHSNETPAQLNARLTNSLRSYIADVRKLWNEEHQPEKGATA